MGQFAEQGSVSVTGPAGLAAHIADQRGWEVTEPGQDGALLAAKGLWRTYDLNLRWIESECAFQLVCMFHMVAPPARMDALRMTLCRINERLLFGHFVLQENTGAVAFRYALPVNPACGEADENLDRMVDLAVEICDRCYPALQLSASTTRNTPAAMRDAILETVGSA